MPAVRNPGPCALPRRRGTAVQVGGRPTVRRQARPRRGAARVRDRGVDLLRVRHTASRTGHGSSSVVDHVSHSHFLLVAVFALVSSTGDS